MIISASRRTDIPSYYGQWFMNRLHEGYVYIPNPYNKERYSKASLTREAVDIIVFWTKNPLPFLKFLPELNALNYPYYFEFTLTPYGKKTEKNLPHKNTLIDVFIDLSNKIGKHRIVWRYDPIIINDEYNIDYHTKYFNYMARKLANKTSRCVISFVDSYKNIAARMGKQPIYQMDQQNLFALAQIFSEIANEHQLELYTCSEEIDLKTFNIHHGACIDKQLIENILNCKINVQIDKNQRDHCLCVESIDIGTYNCCANGCNYCYALTSELSSQNNMKKHNVNSPVLIGDLPKDVIITERKNISVLERQIPLPISY